MKLGTSTQYYKASYVKIQLDQVSVVDKINLHRQTREVIFSYLIQSSNNINKLKIQVTKLHRKLM